MSKIKTETVPCCYCGAPNLKARVDELDYKHCTDIDCVGRFRRERNEQKNLVLVFVHKQGMQWVTKDEVPKNDMRRAGGT